MTTTKNGMRRLRRCVQLSTTVRHLFSEGVEDNDIETTSNDPATYFRRCISIPFVDHMFAYLESRFSCHQVGFLGLCLVPSILVKLPKAEVKTNLAKLTEQYDEDLPSAASMSSQLHWRIKCEAQMKQYGEACLPTTPSMALPHATPSTIT